MSKWTASFTLLSGLLFVMAACNAPGELPVPLGAASASPLPPTAAATAQPTRPPTATPTSVPGGMAIVGPVETVFDWSAERCAYEDIPDLPARAFRDADGTVQLISSHLLGRRWTGAELDQVTHDCTVVLGSDHQADPSLFNDNEWLYAPYTEDGTTIWMLIHNEYHGWEHSADCPPPNHFRCWYNAITLAVSHDGGLSYQDAAPPPDHLVASLPDVYIANAGPYGVMSGTNIVKKDDDYYAFVRIDATNSDHQRQCLMRTDDLSRPDSWRAWDGDEFTIAWRDPYQMDESERGGVPCAAVSEPTLGIVSSSLHYNTFLEQYVLLGESTVHRDGQDIWGIIYATSTDLIHWSNRYLLTAAELPWTYQPGDDNFILYPSLLDPNSNSRNFETADEQAYVYFTRFNRPGAEPLDRDLVRVPVAFFKTVEEAEAAAVPFQVQP